MLFQQHLAQYYSLGVGKDLMGCPEGDASIENNLRKKCFVVKKFVNYVDGLTKGIQLYLHRYPNKTAKEYCQHHSDIFISTK